MSCTSELAQLPTPTIASRTFFLLVIRVKFPFLGSYTYPKTLIFKAIHTIPTFLLDRYKHFYTIIVINLTQVSHILLAHSNNQGFKVRQKVWTYYVNVRISGISPSKLDHVAHL